MIQVALLALELLVGAR